MTWFKARLPDNGSGNTKLNVFAEGNSHEEARNAIKKSGRYTIYNYAGGKDYETNSPPQNAIGIWPTPHSEEKIKELVANVSSPNEMVQSNGVVLIRNSDGEEKVRSIE